MTPTLYFDAGEKEISLMEHLQQFYHNKRILVTGGAGFIASHLVEKLVSLGAKVTVLDNFSTGKLVHLKSVAHAINLFYADVRSEYSCYKATNNQNLVFHFAAFVSVAESMQSPDLCYKINIDGTHNMLKACKKNNIASFIFSSSSAVYGDKNDICSENDALSPQSPYAVSKQEAEILCKQYAHQDGLNTTILRYFNVYGDRQNPQGSYAAVVARFKEQLLTGKPITIFGTGKQTRDFIHVSKIVEATLLMGMKKSSGEVFNIGSGKSLNLFELIEQLEKELKVKKTDISFLPARQGDILHSRANCEKYKSAT